MKLNDEEKIIEQITRFAASAHEGQLRKYVNEPYINHPIRIMQHCRLYDKSIAVAAAALLHDVIEDTSITEAILFDFLQSTMPAEAEHTYSLVIQLTDVFTKDAYPNLNRDTRKQMELERLAHIHPDAQTIKYADIIDNSMDKAVPENDFAPRYLNEYKKLLAVINEGNASLYALAKAEVNRALKKLQQPETAAKPGKRSKT